MNRRNMIIRDLRTFINGMTVDGNQKAVPGASFLDKLTV